MASSAGCDFRPGLFHGCPPEWHSSVQLFFIIFTLIFAQLFTVISITLIYFIKTKKKLQGFRTFQLFWLFALLSTLHCALATDPTGKAFGTPRIVSEIMFELPWAPGFMAIVAMILNWGKALQDLERALWGVDEASILYKALRYSSPPMLVFIFTCAIILGAAPSSVSWAWPLRNAFWVVVNGLTTGISLRFSWKLFQFLRLRAVTPSSQAQRTQRDIRRKNALLRLSLLVIAFSGCMGGYCCFKVFLVIDGAGAHVTYQSLTVALLVWTIEYGIASSTIPMFLLGQVVAHRGGRSSRTSASASAGGTWTNSSANGGKDLELASPSSVGGSRLAIGLGDGSSSSHMGSPVARGNSSDSSCQSPHGSSSACGQSVSAANLALGDSLRESTSSKASKAGDDSSRGSSTQAKDHDIEA